VHTRVRLQPIPLIERIQKTAAKEALPTGWGS